MKKLRFFLDTEFIENGRHNPLYLLSIGVICENGATFYAENFQAPFELANDFVKENVYPHLRITDMKGYSAGALCVRRIGLESIHSPEHIANELQRFIWENCQKGNPIFQYKNGQTIQATTKPEFWGYFCDYDWVLFCQLFGTMSELPKGFPYYCNDLKQLMKLAGENRSLDELVGEKSNHNALSDAKQIRKGFEIIRNGLQDGTYRDGFEL
jgi:hypothetical protein